MLTVSYLRPAGLHCSCHRRYLSTGLSNSTEDDGNLLCNFQPSILNIIVFSAEQILRGTYRALATYLGRWSCETDNDSRPKRELTLTKLTSRYLLVTQSAVCEVLLDLPSSTSPSQLPAKHSRGDRAPTTKAEPAFASLGYLLGVRESVSLSLSLSLFRLLRIHDSKVHRRLGARHRVPDPAEREHTHPCFFPGQVSDSYIFTYYPRPLFFRPLHTPILCLIPVSRLDIHPQSLWTSLLK